ncbi:Mitochondrial fission 1 protein [Savitreella phatthalungensis]
MFEKSALPYAADADAPLKESELAVLRAQYETEGKLVGVQTKFNFAWGLVKSSKRVDQLEGTKLLTEIYREYPDRRRECLYYLALGHFKVGNYTDARKFNNVLLDREPHNMQAQSLRQLIDDRVAKDGYVGMAIVGSAIAIGGIIIGSIARSRK